MFSIQLANTCSNQLIEFKLGRNAVTSWGVVWIMLSLSCARSHCNTNYLSFNLLISLAIISQINGCSVKIKILHLYTQQVKC